MTKRTRRADRSFDKGAYQVGPGTVVTLSYELYDAEGDLVEAALPPDGLEYLHGFGQLVPELERGLEGMAPGQARRLRLGPEQAFGLRDPAKVIEEDRTELPEDVAIGDELLADAEEGAEPVSLTVLELSDEGAVLDANHPLSGQQVELDVVVEAVRPATSPEMEAAAALLESGGAPLRALIPTERLLKRSARQNAGVPGAPAHPNGTPPRVA